MLAAPPRSSALVLATPSGSVPMGWPRRLRIGNWDGNEQAEPMRFHEPSRHVVWLPSEGYFALPYDEGAVHVACIWLGRARAARCARGAPNFFPLLRPVPISSRPPRVRSFSRACDNDNNNNDNATAGRRARTGTGTRAACPLLFPSCCAKPSSRTLA